MMWTDVKINRTFYEWIEWRSYDSFFNTILWFDITLAAVSIKYDKTQKAPANWICA